MAVAVLAASVVAAAARITLAPGQAPLVRLGPEHLSDASVVGTDDLPPVGTITGERDLAGAAPRAGALAPDFTWTGPDGRPGALSALRGREVVVNFWATWCVPCRTEMPALERVAASDPGLTVLEVDLQEDAVAVGAFFKRYGLTSLVPLVDGDGRVFRRYGVLSVPVTVFVDREGVISHIEVGGPLSEERVRALVETARRQ